MNNKLIVSIVEFKLAEGVNENSFLDAANKVLNNFLKKQNGFVSRELLKSKDKWMDIIRWKSSEEAEDSNKGFMNNYDCVSCAKLIDRASMKMAQFEEVKRYDENSHRDETVWQ